MKKIVISEQRKAFTLVELLAVMAIIALVAAFVVPAFTHMSRGRDLADAASQLANEINFTQQLAIKNNQPAQIIFFSYKNSANADTAAHFQAYQVWSQDENGNFQPETKVIPFPVGIRLSGDQLYTTVLKNTPATQPLDNKLKSLLRVPGTPTGTTWTPATPSGSGSGGNGATSTYFQITFHSDGSTDLNPDTSAVGAWSLSVYPTNSPKPASNLQGKEPASDFITLVIDSLNGTIRSFQPGS